MKALMLIAVLLVPGTVWADGWVMWHQLDQSWFIRDAFEQRAECMKVLDNERGFYDLRSQADSKSNVRVKGYSRDGIMIHLKKDGKEVVREHAYWCLPAGTDPRPRQEK